MDRLPRAPRRRGRSRHPADQRELVLADQHGRLLRRFYDEFAEARSRPAWSQTPLGVPVFPHEVVLSIRRLPERAANITRWTELDRGAHFAALEQPELLTTDIRAFFSGPTD